MDRLLGIVMLAGGICLVQYVWERSAASIKFQSRSRKAQTFVLGFVWGLLGLQLILIGAYVTANG